MTYVLKVGGVHDLIAMSTLMEAGESDGLWVELHRGVLCRDVNHQVLGVGRFKMTEGTGE